MCRQPWPRRVSAATGGHCVPRPPIYPGPTGTMSEPQPTACISGDSGAFASGACTVYSQRCKATRGVRLAAHVKPGRSSCTAAVLCGHTRPAGGAVLSSCGGFVCLRNSASLCWRFSPWRWRALVPVCVRHMTRHAIACTLSCASPAGPNTEGLYAVPPGGTPDVPCPGPDRRL